MAMSSKVNQLHISWARNQFISTPRLGAPRLPLPLTPVSRGFDRVSLQRKGRECEQTRRGVLRSYQEVERKRGCLTSPTLRDTEDSDPVFFRVSKTERRTFRDPLRSVLRFSG